MLKKVHTTRILARIAILIELNVLEEFYSDIKTKKCKF